MSDLEGTRAKCVSRMSKWKELGADSPRDQEIEKLIFLLRYSACQEDWKHVADLVDERL